MAEELTEPPTLTAKDVEKVEALIDPNPLPCGGRGLIESAARTTRWTFGRRSTAAVARAHLGYGWPAGVLRSACPAGLDRCLTHRSDDPGTVSPELPFSTPPTSPNTVTDASNRAPAEPGGNGVVEVGRADEALLRGAGWATRAATAGTGSPHPGEPFGGSVQPAESVAPNLAPSPVTSSGTGTKGGTDPLPPKGGQGVTVTTGAGANPGATVPVPGRPRPPRSRRTRPLTARTRGRAAKTVAAVAASLALVYGVSRCTEFVTSIEPPTIGPYTTEPAEAPTTPDPLLPPDTTAAPTTETTAPLGPTFTMPPPCTPSSCPSLDD